MNRLNQNKGNMINSKENVQKLVNIYSEEGHGTVTHFVKVQILKQEIFIKHNTHEQYVLQVCITFVTSPSNGDDSDVRKLERKCAICTIKESCRLLSFTVNYIHPYHRFCQVRSHLQIQPFRMHTVLLKRKSDKNGEKSQYKNIVNVMTKK